MNLHQRVLRWYDTPAFDSMEAMYRWIGKAVEERRKASFELNHCPLCTAVRSFESMCASAPPMNKHMALAAEEVFLGYATEKLDVTADELRQELVRRDELRMKAEYWMFPGYLHAWMK